MSKAGQNFLLQEIRRAIEYCAKEYDMTWAEAIGCLNMCIHYYNDLAFNSDYEEDEEDEEENEM